MPPPFVSQQDVAAKAGVSKTAVSLALRHSPRISARTGARIRRIAEQLGYRPDPVLSARATRHWRSGSLQRSTLAFVYYFTDWDRPLIENQLFVGLEQAAQAAGYGFEPFNLGEYASAERASRVLYNRGHRGLIIAPIYDSARRIALHWPWFCAVACNLSYSRPPTPLVDHNYFRSIELAFQHALKAGHHRIGLVLLQDAETDSDVYRYAAFRWCQESLPKRDRLPMLRLPFSNSAPLFPWVKRHRPTAIIGLNDLVYWWLLEAGYRIPDDVSFISLMKDLRFEPWRIAGLDPCWAELGRSAIDLLDALLRSNKFGLLSNEWTVRVRQRWSEGRSLATC